MVLRRAGCCEVISGKPAKSPGTRATGDDWDKRSEEGLTAIGLTIQPNQYRFIKEKIDSAAAWKSLPDIYERIHVQLTFLLNSNFTGSDMTLH